MLIPLFPKIPGVLKKMDLRDSWVYIYYISGYRCIYNCPNYCIIPLESEKKFNLIYFILK